MKDPSIQTDHGIIAKKKKISKENVLVWFLFPKSSFWLVFCIWKARLAQGKAQLGSARQKVDSNTSLIIRLLKRYFWRDETVPTKQILSAFRSGWLLSSQFCRFVSCLLTYIFLFWQLTQTVICCSLNNSQNIHRNAISVRWKNS